LAIMTIAYRRLFWCLHALVGLFLLVSLSGCQDNFSNVATLAVDPPPSESEVASPEPAITDAPAGRSGQVGFPDCISPDAPQKTGRVTSITDGDTIHVVAGGREYTVRYTSIDAPEDTKEVEPYGPEATALNRELVKGQIVTLIQDVSETDPYGRMLSYVFVGEVFVNYELVREGLANARSYPPDVACLDTLREAEKAARSEGLGMWAGDENNLSAPCDCSGSDLDCSDFDKRVEAQACYDYCSEQGLGDVFHLDGEDQDGRVCETMP